MMFATLSVALIQLLCLNPHRSQQQLAQDAKMVYEQVVATQEGDQIRVIDIYGTEILVFNNTGGTQLAQVYKAKEAVQKLKQYCQQALRAYPRQAQQHDVPAMFGRIAQQIPMGDGELVVVVFDSGINNSDWGSFKQAYPGMGFLSQESSPFAPVPQLKGRWVMVTRRSDFVNLKHEMALKSFYARLLADRGATLVGYSPVKGMVKQVIEQDIRTPVVEDLGIEQGPLILHGLSENIIEKQPDEDLVQIPTQEMVGVASLYRDGVIVEGRVARISGWVDADQGVELGLRGHRQKVSLDSDGRFQTAVVLGQGKNEIGLYMKNVLVDTLTIDAPDIQVSELQFMLTWQKDRADLDLYVETPQDWVWFRNKKVGELAQLDVDVTTGYGPENVSIEQHVAGIYRVYCHYYAAHGVTDPVPYQVDVYRQGHKVKQHDGQLTDASQMMASPENVGQGASWQYVGAFTLP